MVIGYFYFKKYYLGDRLGMYLNNFRVFGHQFTSHHNNSFLLKWVSMKPTIDYSQFYRLVRACLNLTPALFLEKPRFGPTLASLHSASRGTKNTEIQASQLYYRP